MKYYALDTPYTKKLFHHVRYPVSLVSLDVILTAKENVVLIVDDIYENIPDILIQKFYTHTVYYLHHSKENQLLTLHQDDIEKWTNFISISIFQTKQALFSKLFSKVYQTHLIIAENTSHSIDILDKMLPDIYASKDKESCLFVDFYPSADLMNTVEGMSLWHYYQALQQESIPLETLIKQLVKMHPTKPLQILSLKLTLKEYLDIDLKLLETLIHALKAYYNIYYLCDHVKSAIDYFMISTVDIIYTDCASKAFIEKSFQKEVVAIELLS